MIASFYNPETGLFTGTFTGPPLLLERNTPPGLKSMPGRYDPRTQRVDLETGVVVAYEAPPDPAAEARERRRKARRHIAMLEKQQARPLRELSIDPTNPEARRRLEAIEAEIAALRADLTAGS